MSRALRFAPPVAERSLVLRPRLLAHLHGRFERPLTAIVAPAGFGKTTLLSQAVGENALSPVGEDHWLTCQRADTALSFLAAGTFAAVDLHTAVPDDPTAAAIAVAAAMWSAAPRQIALVLDDAHLIEPDSPGSAFLRQLVEELPRNGHLVVSARPPLPLPIARLLASGAAMLLGEDDLQFQPDELESFADHRGVPMKVLSKVGGWPALAELTATLGPHAADGYVREELLSQLPPDRRRALALIAAVGGVDVEIAGAILGSGRDLAGLLAGLPLVVSAASGWRSLHAMWGSVLQDELDPLEVAEARRIAGRVLMERRQFHDAMDLLIDAEAWPEVKALIVTVCEVCTPLVPPDVLEVWLHRLPLALRGSPEGLLLAAMVAEPVSRASAERLLEQALAGTPDGDPSTMPVRYACLNALIQLAFWRSDRRRMKLLADRLTELAEAGHPEAPGWIALLTAVLARTPAQVRTALADPRLASGTALNPVQDWLHAHILLLKLGDAEAAAVLAQRALAQDAITMQAVTRCALLDSARLRGRPDDVDRLLPELLGDLNPSKVLTSPELVTCAVTSLCVQGQRDQGAQLLAAFGPTIAASPVVWATIAGALAAAFHAVSTGDESAAAAQLAAISGLSVVHNQAVVQISPVALPLLYVLVPETRALWDSEEPAGAFADMLQLAQALVALREQRPLNALRTLTPEARQMIRLMMPPPWATELGLGLAAVGRPEGVTLLEDLGREARSILRDRVGTAAPAIAATARALLRELPAIPAQPVHLLVLGQLELRRGGAVIIAPELRRERVRQLLAYLLSHSRPSRAAIVADLWPDLDESAAGKNLRVTLAYLQNVFEPDRNELDPPYFVRSSHGGLHLVVDDALQVDSVQFERHLDEALRLDRKGVPSAALAEYENALELWRGDYFGDLPADEWLQRERDRVRGRFVAAALRAGNLLLARGDVERARELADRTLAADMWSESAYQLLVAAYLASGDLVSAQRSLRRCRQMLRELGVSAHQRTLALARQLDAAL